MKKLYIIAFNFFFLFHLVGQNYAVGNTTITFNDPNRSGGFGSGGGSGRQIQTEIYYPALSAGTDVALAPGEFPVIVFGHGFAMVWSAYQNIWEEFAPLGYILAFPRTEGSLLPPPSHQDFGLDLALVETKMQAENSNVNSIFYQQITSSSAIIGHSMGGGASFLGASNNNSPSLKTVVGLAPAETNPSAIAAASNVSQDVLIFSGSSDGVTPPSSNHQPIYNNAASTCKTFISITNGSHCYFANSNFNCDFGELTTGTGSLSRGAQQDITSDYLKLWLAFKLKNSCKAWDEFQDSLSVSNRIVEQQQCTYGNLQPEVDLSGNAVFCQGTFSPLYATSNPSYTYLWYGNNDTLPFTNDSIQVNSSGVYQVVASNSLGCKDSSNLFTVFENPSYVIRDTVNACLGSTYTFPDGFTSMSDTTYTSFLLTNSNCDSIIERTVFFGSTVSGQAIFNLCQGDTFTFNGNQIWNDTVFNDTLLNGSVFSCDSVSIIQVHFATPDTVMISPQICQGENYQLPTGLFVNYSDTFYFEYTNQQACDSIFQINLSAGSPITNFNLIAHEFPSWIGDTLIVEPDIGFDADSIIWDNDVSLQFLQSTGDSALFLLTSDEICYWIQADIFYQGCSNSSSIDLCFVGLQERNNQQSFNIYPNPGIDWITIENKGTEQYIIFNILGKPMKQGNIGAHEAIRIDDLPPAWYILKTNLSQSLFLKQ